MPEMRDEIVKDAVLRAADILSGMGYTGPRGSIHLLDLNLQSNTITSILHNMVAWQISKLDPRWEFHPKGGRTADLTSADGAEIQIKTTSDEKIKGNYVSAGRGYYVCVKYRRKRGDEIGIEIREVMVGDLTPADWDKKAGTQLAILKREAEQRMRRIRL
jgi:hypothetical protein